MSLSLYHEQSGARVYHGDAIGPLPEPCDLLCVDAPYSEKTHAGHDGAARWDPGTMADPGKLSRPIDFPLWLPDDVERAVAAWEPMTRGWFVSITDHILAPVWAVALEAAGRYVFAPLPWLAPGRGVRLAGDGPSSWTCWIIVARPRCAPYSKWGTLQGGYVVNQDRDAIVGGKPLQLMRALIRDYSRAGDVVLDPCMGAGTTLRAALDMGRKAVGIDIKEEHCALTVARLRQGTLPGLFPTPREITDEDAARIVREGGQIRREMEELTAPMLFNPERPIR